MKQIALTRGFVALVDDEDYCELNAHNWRTFVRYRKDGTVRVAYAARNLPRVGSHRPLVYMHAHLANPEAGLQVDHVDGNGLNNTRANLRVVTPTQNQRNQTNKACGKSSRYRGVSWNKADSLWQVHIKTETAHEYLGAFKSEFQAAGVYDAAGLARDPAHFTPNFSASWLAP